MSNLKDFEYFEKEKLKTFRPFFFSICQIIHKNNQKKQTMSKAAVLPPITALFPGITDINYLPFIPQISFIDANPAPEKRIDIDILPLKKRPTPTVVPEALLPIKPFPKKETPRPVKIATVKPTTSQNQTSKSSQSNIKNKFTAEEDKLLIELASKSKVHNWNDIAEALGTRNARQCRERWNNYLNPTLRNDPWTEEEDRLLLEKHHELGTHWNKIAKSFKNRSDNSIRNRWQLLMRHMEKQQGNSSPSPQLSE